MLNLVNHINVAIVIYAKSGKSFFELGNTNGNIHDLIKVQQNWLKIILKLITNSNIKAYDLNFDVLFFPFGILHEMDNVWFLYLDIYKECIKLVFMFREN